METIAEAKRFARLKNNRTNSLELTEDKTKRQDFQPFWVYRKSHLKSANSLLTKASLDRKDKESLIKLLHNYVSVSNEIIDWIQMR